MRYTVALIFSVLALCSVFVFGLALNGMSQTQHCECSDTERSESSSFFFLFIVGLVSGCVALAGIAVEVTSKEFKFFYDAL